MLKVIQLLAAELIKSSGGQEAHGLPHPSLSSAGGSVGVASRAGVWPSRTEVCGLGWVFSTFPTTVPVPQAQGQSHVLEYVFIQSPQVSGMKKLCSEH